MAQKKRMKPKKSATASKPAAQRAPMDQNTKIMIALVAVVIVLIAVVGFMYTQRQGDKVADTSTNTAANNTASNGTAADIQEVEFSPATATSVPSGETPQEFLERYLTATENQEWSAGFEMLPLDRKNYYKDAMSYASQLGAYGINGHDPVSVVSEGTDKDGNPEIVLKGVMKTAENGSFAYDWTFVQVDGTWYVKTRGNLTMQ